MTYTIYASFPDAFYATNAVRVHVATWQPKTYDVCALCCLKSDRGLIGPLIETDMSNAGDLIVSVMSERS
jgi:hypothetical protein